MGGVSSGEITADEIDGVACVCMQGLIRTENNGGFVQLSAELPRVSSLDYDRFTGLLLRVRGNDETYTAHLRTSELSRPWQSYRQPFDARPQWRTVALPFGDFQPHRTDVPMDLSNLTKLGLVAIGRAFDAELCVSRISLYNAKSSRIPA